MRPEDDFTHDPGPEPTFNESMYVHFHDMDGGVAGFVRLANRPNEGRGEMTVCLFLPDGRLGFTYARPAVHNNEAFDAAGLRLVVRDPLRHVEVSFDGPVSVLADPQSMADPKRAFSHSPIADCRIRLDVHKLSPPCEQSFDPAEGSFAPNHYSQLVSIQGRIELDGAPLPVRGHGLRDHSWGPHQWRSPWFYRWLHGCAGDIGFMGAYFGHRDGSSVRGGFLWDGNNVRELDDLEITTERDDLDQQLGVRAVLHVDGAAHEVQGRVDSCVPLRNRQDAGTGELQVTRIVEGSTMWAFEDDRTMQGMTEYLDQVVGGRPVGAAV